MYWVGTKETKFPSIDIARKITDNQYLGVCKFKEQDCNHIFSVIESSIEFGESFEIIVNYKVRSESKIRK